MSISCIVGCIDFQLLLVEGRGFSGFSIWISFDLAQRKIEVSSLSAKHSSREVPSGQGRCQRETLLV